MTIADIKLKLRTIYRKVLVKLVRTYVEFGFTPGLRLKGGLAYFQASIFGIYFKVFVRRRKEERLFEFNHVKFRSFYLKLILIEFYLGLYND